MRTSAPILTVFMVAVLAVAGPAAAASTTRPGSGASLAAVLREGAAAFRAGRLRDADATFTRAAKLAPREPHAWIWLGAVRYHRGDFAGAATLFEYAARLRPRDGTVLLWWGHALWRAGATSEAEAAFRRALLTAGGQRVHEMARQALRTMRPVPHAAADEPAGVTLPAWAGVVENYRALAQYYNPRLRPDEADIIARSLLEYSRQFNIDPRLVVALVVVESGFQPRVRSRAGALGLGQLMPETARALRVNPLDPMQNLYGTVRYLRGNLDHFGWDNAHLALAAYNAGRGAVERYEGIPPYDETRWYVYNVSTLYRRLLSL